MNKYEFILAIQQLVKGKMNDISEENTVDLSKILYDNNCHYLLEKIEGNTEYIEKNKISLLLNKAVVRERYNQCRMFFNELKKQKIPYALLKGVPLSNYAYGDYYYRFSSDIDILLYSKNLNIIKEIFYQCGFIQGRLDNDDIIPYSREEKLFHLANTHQTAPFIRNTESRLCPYVNIDINTNIYWGESGIDGDISSFLEDTRTETLFGNIDVQVLSVEKSLIALCLHHFKDMNSIFLLYERNGFKLSLLSDLYFFVKNTPINKDILNEMCEKILSSNYLYFCLYHASRIFGEDITLSLKNINKNEDLLWSYGLSDKEKQAWERDWLDLIIDNRVNIYMKDRLNSDQKNKIRHNLKNI